MANQTILVIDYEPRSIERLRIPLERAGYRVVTAMNGATGIEMFHRIRPTAVILEAMLPKRHGFEVCSELKGSPHGAFCPVVIATSVYRGRKYRHQATHQYKADAFLEKPVADDELLRTLTASIERYARARADVAQAETDALEFDTTNAPDESVPAAAAAAPKEPEPDDFDIVDRLDELLSDDPSKSHPPGR